MEIQTSSRRRFIKSATTASIAIAVIGFDGVRTAEAAVPIGGRPRSFRIDCDESIRVGVTAGRRFDVTVTDTDGNVLERRRNLSVQRLLMLRSGYFTASEIEPPRGS